VFLNDPKPYAIHEQFVFFVFHAYQICESVRGLCIATLSKAVVVENKEVVRAALSALCNVEVCVSSLPMIDLLTALNAGILVPEIIKLFAGLPKLPPSRRLFSALIGVLNRSPLTIICFCKMAADSDSVELFLSGFGWLSDLNLNDAFVVLLTVCVHPEGRQEIVKAPELLPFLAKIAEQGNLEELDAVVPFLRRLQTDADFIRALDLEKFFLRNILRDVLEMRRISCRKVQFC
jgi:hypothetical protein